MSSRMTRYKIKYYARETWKSRPVMLILLGLLSAVLSGGFAASFSAARVTSETLLSMNARTPINEWTFAQVVSEFPEEAKAVSDSLFATGTFSESGPLLSRVLHFAFIAVLMLLFFFFVSKVFEAVAARICLESGTYRKIPLSRFLYPYRFHVWEQTAKTMAVRFLLTALWSLTIVGGAVRYYQWILTPYLLAENPLLSTKEALALSRDMMKGKKRQRFVLDLSFLPWEILSVATLGVLRFIYVGPYRMLSNAEFYKAVRREYLEECPEKAGILNDRYLYEEASDEILNHAYGSTSRLSREEDLKTVESGSKGFRRALENILALIPRHDVTEREYREKEIRLAELREAVAAKEKRVYPMKLYPLSERADRLCESRYFLRHYSLLSILFLFLFAGFFGDVVEVFGRFLMTGRISNAALLPVPFRLFYGLYAVLFVTLFSSFRRRPMLEFVLSGAFAFALSWLLNPAMGLSGAGYTYLFLARNGLMNPEGVVFFAAVGVILIYVVMPLLDNEVGRRIDGKGVFNGN